MLDGLGAGAGSVAEELDVADAAGRAGADAAGTRLGSEMEIAWYGQRAKVCAG